MNEYWDAPWMSADHHQFQDLVMNFMRKEVAPNVEGWTKAGSCGRDIWLKAGEMGLLGASIPEEYGGSGGDLGFDVLTEYHQARVGDTGWGVTIAFICSHYLVSYGTPEQKQKWLPGWSAGTAIPAIAMTEPGTGSDLQSVKTTARREGDEYVINGSKIFISNGQLCDQVLLVVKTDPDARARGISLIVVDTAETPGFSRGRNLDKLGMKGQDTSELFFEDVRVPAANLLGEVEGQGFVQLMTQLAWERLMLALQGLGACDCALEHTIRYVNEREAFGQKLIAFQNTRFKLAEAQTKTDVTRAFLNEAVQKLLDNKLDAATASKAKYWSSDIQNEVIDECLQLLGGYGYMMEYPLARLYADARVQKIYGGTNEIQKELIAKSFQL